MKKVSIIYFSNAGNVEVLANKIFEGAKGTGAEVNIKSVLEAKEEDVTNADAVAFGSPSRNNNNIEQDQMAPFLEKFKLLNNNNKPAVLFGSYGWDNGEFMDKFKKVVTDYGFKIVGDIAVKETPNNEELKKAEDLGKLLAR